MAPLLFLLVFDPENMAHYNEVAILISVLKGWTKNITESVQARATLALIVVDFNSGCRVKELEEV